MKFCMLLCALLAVVCVSGQGPPIKTCNAGQHSVLYCPRKAEPDCTNPTVHDYDPKDPTVRPCGVPDCFCDSPTVRDLNTKKCVPLDKCPKIVQ